VIFDFRFASRLPSAVPIFEWKKEERRKYKRASCLQSIPFLYSKIGTAEGSRKANQKSLLRHHKPQSGVELLETPKPSVSLIPHATLQITPDVVDNPFDDVGRHAGKA